MSRRIPQAHDRFFKLLLEQPRIAKALIHERLPSDLVARLADVNPEPLATEFVGDRLRSVLADKVFRLPLRDLPGASLLSLIEHKSFQTPGFRFQLLKDLDGVLQHLVLRREVEFTAVTPLVVYHGAAPWKGGDSYGNGLSWLPGLSNRGVDLSFYLFDLGQMDEESLSADPWLRGGLRMLLHGTRPLDPRRARELLASTFGELRGCPAPLLRGAAHYVLEKWRPIAGRDLEEVMCGVLAEEEQKVVSKAAEEFIDKGKRQGKRQGKLEGMLEGRLEGKREQLLELMQYKFGPIPEWLRLRIQRAPHAEIAHWSYRLLDAASLDDVFDESETRDE